MAEMKEVDPIRVVSRIKNNRLLECREEMGMTVIEFIEYVGISIGTYYNTVSLKRYPSMNIAEQIAKKTGYSVDYLFPDYLKNISKTVAVRTISEPQLVALSEAKQFQLLTDGGIDQVDDIIYAKEARKVISYVVGSLSPRLEQVIRMRYGLDGQPPTTLEETGERLHLTRERIRQIECQALNYLRKDFRRKALAERLGIKFEKPVEENDNQPNTEVLNVDNNESNNY